MDCVEFMKLISLYLDGELEESGEKFKCEALSP